MPGSEIHYFEQILLLKDAIREKGDEIHQLQMDLVSQIHALEKDIITLRSVQTSVNERINEVLQSISKTTEKLEQADTVLRQSQERHIYAVMQLASQLGQTINVHQDASHPTTIDRIDTIDGDIVGGDKQSDQT